MKTAKNLRRIGKRRFLYYITQLATEARHFDTVPTTFPIRLSTHSVIHGQEWHETQVTFLSMSRSLAHLRPGCQTGPSQNGHDSQQFERRTVLIAGLERPCIHVEKRATQFPVQRRLRRELGRGYHIVLGGPGLQIALEALEASRQGELRLNTLDAVGRVDVLDQRELEACGRALAGDDGRVGKEVLPDLWWLKSASSPSECTVRPGT